MILITGATGNLGGHVLNNLLKTTDPSNIAVLVRDENKAADLKSKGVDVRVANFHDSAALTQAFKGITKALLISSSDLEDRLGQHKNVIDAAKKAGVEHIVYTGVSMNDINDSALKDFMIDHYQTEDYIKDSGLTYTFLQHNLYADVIPMFIGEKALETGVFFPAGSGRIPFALRSEMGEAAANILLTDGHENKTYKINGGENYSFNDVASELSKIAGKEIPYIDADPAQFTEVLKGAGVPEGIIHFSLGFAAAMKNDDFNLQTNDLENILGRKPATLDKFLAEAYSTQNA
jgi:NAD(P)H dehydrogenase (quinone)